MRPRRPGATLSSMSTPQRVRAQVEIERTERTITGQLAIDGAPATDFFGWLELIDALERATSQLAVRAEPNKENEPTGNATETLEQAAVMPAEARTRDPNWN